MFPLIFFADQLASFYSIYNYLELKKIDLPLSAKEIE